MTSLVNFSLMYQEFQLFSINYDETPCLGTKSVYLQLFHWFRYWSPMCYNVPLRFHLIQFDLSARSNSPNSSQASIQASTICLRMSPHLWSIAVINELVQLCEQRGKKLPMRYVYSNPSVALAPFLLQLQWLLFLVQWHASWYACNGRTSSS